MRRARLTLAVLAVTFAAAIYAGAGECRAGVIRRSRSNASSTRGPGSVASTETPRLLRRSYPEAETALAIISMGVDGDSSKRPARSARTSRPP